MKINLKLLVFLSISIFQGCQFLAGNISAEVLQGFPYDGVPYKYQLVLNNTERGLGWEENPLGAWLVPSKIGSDVILTDKIEGKIDISSIVVFSRSSKKHKYFNNGFIEFSNSRLVVSLQLLSDDGTPDQEYRYNGKYRIIKR